MDNTFLLLKTAPDLLEKLKSALTHRHSPEEIFKQRISFIFGSMRQDSGVTKERIREVLRKHDGY